MLKNKSMHLSVQRWTVKMFYCQEVQKPLIQNTATRVLKNFSVQKCELLGTPKKDPSGSEASGTRAGHEEATHPTQEYEGWLRVCFLLHCCVCGAGWVWVAIFLLS